MGFLVGLSTSLGMSYYHFDDRKGRKNPLRSLRWCNVILRDIIPKNLCPEDDEYEIPSVCEE